MTSGGSGTAVGTAAGVPDRAWTMPWAAAGTEVLLGRLGAVDVTAPSRLPGWTHGHVAGHVARNAEALGRLLTWARTGVETPMYASPAQRAAEIARDADRPLDVQLADVGTTAAALAGAMATLPPAAWTAQVRSARGRLIPATEIPWMRVKEVWLHALDLGEPVAAVPGDVAAALFADVATGFAARADVPGLRLEPAGDTVGDMVGDVAGVVAGVVIGDGATTVKGSAVSLLTWLTGRSDGTDLDGPAPLPPLPTWL